MVGPSKRNLVLHVLAIAYAVGVALLMAFAWSFEDWRWLQTVVGLTTLIAIPYMW